MCFPGCTLHVHAKRFLEWMQDVTEVKVGVVGVSTTEDGKMTMMAEEADDWGVAVEWGGDEFCSGAVYT